MITRITKTREQLIEELYQVPDNGKAEIIDGKIIRMSPTGHDPGRAALKIAVRLDRYEEESGVGRAFGNSVGFLVDLPNRGSFCPDAAFYIGPRTGGKFVNGAPIFAVEVRSESDYSPRAEERIQRKIREYFQAGTQVVWDVDVLREGIIRVYRAIDPDNPTIYRRGEIAEAEPALPGWTMPVDVIFA
jgi:Uma2 family endonuclease